MPNTSSSDSATTFGARRGAGGQRGRWRPSARSSPLSSPSRTCTPHLRRITFGGGDLATFTPLGPDTFLYVLLPPPGRSALTIDGGFTWEAWGRMADAERPVGAYYTMREWRPDVGELDMLFVLHEPAGPASAWAARARPGRSGGAVGPT